MTTKTKRLTIRAAVERTGFSATTLRVLDRKGVVRPRRDHVGWRVYTEDDIAKLRALAGLPPEATP